MSDPPENPRPSRAGRKSTGAAAVTRKLGVIVGAAILLTNARTLMSTFGIQGPALSATYLGIVVVVGAVAAWRLSQARSRRRAAAPVLPEPAVELAS